MISKEDIEAMQPGTPEKEECCECKGFGGYYFSPGKSAPDPLSSLDECIWKPCARCDGFGFVDSALDTPRDQR